MVEHHCYNLDWICRLRAYSTGLSQLSSASNWRVTRQLAATAPYLRKAPIEPVPTYLELACETPECFALQRAFASYLIVITFAVIDFSPMPHLLQSTEFVEENWFALQVTLPIPFTTELDQKRFMTNNATTIFWLCLTAGLVLLQAVGEAWKGLGGMMRLVQLKFAIMLPELVPLVVLGSTTAAYSIWAAGVAVFALDVKDGTNVILWQAALGMLVVVGAAATFAMRARWGITFASHAVPALVFGFLSLVMMITSSIIYHRANGVDAFVSANWDTSISFLVPPEFAANSWDKYAMESQTPMLQAAMTGFLTSVLLLCSVGMHLRCASVLLSVGSDLYMSRSRSQALHAVLAEKLAASKGLLVTSANPVYRGVGDSAASRYSDNPSSRVADWDGEDGGNTAAPSAPGASTGSRLAPLLDANGISSGNASSAAVFGSPRGIGGKSFTFSRGSDPGTPIGAAAGTVSSLSARSPRAYGTLGSDYSGKTSFPPQSSDGYQSAVYSSASAFNGAATAQPATALSAMQARMAAMQQYKYLLDVLEKQTADLEKRVTAPSMGTFFRTLSHEFKTSIMATHKAFVLTVVAVVVIACVSIGAGLSPLHSAATCGVLARSPATRTYSLDFQLEFGTQRQLYADITIENMFPFGGINVEVEHVAVYPETRTDEATIELVAMAADEADLPSLAQLAGAVNLTDFVDGAQNSDDDVGGFLYLSVGLPRPDNADAKCLGLKIRFYTIVGTMFVAVKSGTRIVNVTGNALDLETNKGAPFAFQTLDVVTDTAPIVLNNIYTDRIGLSPTAGVAVTHIKSFSGDVWINFLLSNGLRVDTGGSIHTKTLGSFSAINCVGAVCNDVYLTTTGAGKIVVQGAFGAYNVSGLPQRGVWLRLPGDCAHCKTRMKHALHSEHHALLLSHPLRFSSPDAYDYYR